MIRTLFNLPKRVVVAFSGGVDSVAAVDFLSRSKHVECAFFHHNSGESDKEIEFVEKFCSERNLKLHYGKLDCEKPNEQSTEEHWRNKRYEFLEKLPSVVITAHHLDDCMETYLFSAMHGTPKVIPPIRNNVIRPFLITKKSDLRNWCLSNNCSWVEDDTNNDTKFKRNYIRHHVVPHALQVNPGFHKVIRKITEKRSLDFIDQYNSLIDSMSSR